MARRLRAEGVNMLEFRAMTQNFSPAILELDAAMRSGRLRHDGVPVLAEQILAKAPGQGLTGPAASANVGAVAKLRRLWRWSRKDEQRRLLNCALPTTTVSTWRGSRRA